MNKFYLEDTNTITGEQTKRELTWKALVHFLSLDTTKHTETKVDNGRFYSVHTHIFESIRHGHQYKIYFENGCLF